MRKPSEDLQEPNWIEIEDFEYICFNLTRKLLTFNEPIPDYSTRDRSSLESSLSAPKNTYFNQEGSSLPDLASVLFYSIIKNHPFVNGNKRIAVMSVLIFFAINNKWVNIPPDILYNLAKIVAESSPSLRKHNLQRSADLFNKYLVDYKEAK